MTGIMLVVLVMVMSTVIVMLILMLLMMVTVAMARVGYVLARQSSPNSGLVQQTSAQEALDYRAIDPPSDPKGAPVVMMIVVATKMATLHFPCRYTARRTVQTSGALVGPNEPSGGVLETSGAVWGPPWAVLGLSSAVLGSLGSTDVSQRRNTRKPE